MGYATSLEEQRVHLLCCFLEGRIFSSFSIDSFEQFISQNIEGKIWGKLYFSALKLSYRQDVCQLIFLVCVKQTFVSWGK